MLVRIRCDPDSAPVAMTLNPASAKPVFPPTFNAVPVLLNTFCKSGVFGDPRAADAEKGKKLLEGLTVRSVELVREFLKHP